jgi:alkaline phosphatase
MRNWFLKLCFAMPFICLSFVFSSALANSKAHKFGRRAKNIIFMVADGMGLSNVTAARIYKNGPNGPSLYFETLPNIGYQRTHSAHSMVTDSAAAASAWACGEKFDNGEICYHSQDGTYNPTILELAKEKGKATGLVATSEITHATPAVWGSHVHSRACQTEIARQYIEETGVDVMLGGGRRRFHPPIPDKCGTSGDFIAEAENKGYVVVYTKSDMESAVAGGTTKLLGLFTSDGGLTPEKDRTSDLEEPRLPEMTSAALNILEKNPKGFFLMVEGSQIDWANHGNDLEYQITEILAFDQAVKVVLDWIDARPHRRRQTLLIVVSDHDTGGFAITGPTNRLAEAGGFVQGNWVSFGHTAQDTIVWSQGPGSHKLARPLDNTDLYLVMKTALQ